MNLDEAEKMSDTIRDCIQGTWALKIERSLSVVFGI